MWTSASIEVSSQSGVHISMMDDTNLELFKNKQSYLSYTAFSPSQQITCANINNNVNSESNGLNFVILCSNINNCIIDYKFKAYKNNVINNTGYYVGGGVVFIIIICIIVGCCCYKQQQQPVYPQEIQQLPQLPQPQPQPQLGYP